MKWKSFVPLTIFTLTEFSETLIGVSNVYVLFEAPVLNDPEVV